MAHLFDLYFADPSFAATTVDVRFGTTAGEMFFAKHFGGGAVSATLKKSGAYDMMAAAHKAGLKYKVADTLRG